MPGRGRELKPTATRFVAFDLGTSTGWAASIDGRVLSGHLSLFQKGASEGFRFLRLRGFLRRMFDACGGWDCCFYENARAVRFAGPYAATSWGSYWGILTGFCAENNVPVKGFAPSQIKLYSTGIGSASKDLVLMRVRERWSPLVSSRDEADALALLFLGLETVDMPRPELIRSDAVDPAEEICETHRRVKQSGICQECPVIEAGA